MTKLAAGNATPPGAHLRDDGVNFTLFSAHAERVELCLFDDEGNEQRVDLPSAVPGMSGTVFWKVVGQACITATGCMAPGTLRKGTVSTRRNYYSILARSAWKATCLIARYSMVVMTSLTPTIMPPLPRAVSWCMTSSTGGTMPRRVFPGVTPLFMKRTLRD